MESIARRIYSNHHFDLLDEFCISTLSLSLEMTIFVIHNCYPCVAHRANPTVKTICKIEKVHNRTTTLKWSFPISSVVTTIGLNHELFHMVSLCES